MFPDGQDYRRPRSFTDTPLFAVVNAAACATAALAAAACLTMWAVTFTPWARHLPSAAFVPLFVLMFPLFGWSVWLISVARRPRGASRNSADWMKAIPRAGQVLVALVVAAAVTGGLAGGSELGGQPGYHPTTHQYTLNNHGSLTVVSRAAYLQALGAQNRLFLGVTLVFLTAAFAISYGDWSRHRPASFPPSGSFSPSRQPRPERPRPRVPVPAPALAFTAAVALAAAAAGGLQIIDRTSGWSSHAIYLHAGHAVAAQLAPGQYTVFAGCTEGMTCARLGPGSVTVRGANDEVEVGPDPSSDHDSEGGQPFVGELSFSIARASAVRIELAAAAGQPVFVVPSEGQLARSLARWIALAAAALVILALSLAGLLVLAVWRLTSDSPTLQAGMAPP